MLAGKVTMAEGDEPVVFIRLTLEEATRLRQLVGVIGGGTDATSKGPWTIEALGLHPGLRHELTNPLYHALSKAGISPDYLWVKEE